MDDIHYLIQQQENRKLEFKEKLPAMEKIAITAVAFSNAQGGHLIIGISDDGKLIGVDENNIIQYEEVKKLPSPKTCELFAFFPQRNHFLQS